MSANVDRINEIRTEFNKIIDSWDINDLSSPILVEKALKTEQLLTEIAVLG